MAQYISDVAGYFKDLCVNHPDLAHDDAPGSRVFEAIAYEEAFGDFRTASKEKDYFVRMLMPSMTFERSDDNARKVYQVGLMVGKYYSKREDPSTAKMSAWADAERVADDFVARMIYDSREGHPIISDMDNVQQLGLSGEFMDNEGDGSYAAVLYIFDLTTFRCLTGTQDSVGWIDLE